MKRLKYSQETYDLLLNLAEDETCYWRYQDAKHKGIIPVGHNSHERIFEAEEPEYIEGGASCYDNPWQLVSYVRDEGQDLDTTDVILFVGDYMGTGIDGEDIVKVTEESDVLYSLSLRDFYKFTINIPEDLYWNTYNVKEIFCDYDDEFIEKVITPHKNKIKENNKKQIIYQRNLER